MPRVTMRTTGSPMGAAPEAGTLPYSAINGNRTSSGALVLMQSADGKVLPQLASLSSNGGARVSFGGAPPASPQGGRFHSADTQTSIIGAPTCDKSFYKRRLMPPAIAFSSPEGEAIFAEALMAGTMRGFFKLIEQYNTQAEPAYCGLASVAMVLNALAIDPRRVWKGPWRWFHEEMLDCCKSVELVKQEGLTLSQAACTAHCNGARVDLQMFGGFTLEQFRQAVVESCSSETEHLIVSYSRKAVQQTGDGHFSPIGGYNSSKDLVLLLDVARFKYPPHWVPVATLFEAMSFLDPATEKPRGYMRLSRMVKPSSISFTLDIDGASWEEAALFIKTTGPQWLQILASGPEESAEALLLHLVDMAPLNSVDAFVLERKNQKHHDGPCGCLPAARGTQAWCSTCAPKSARRQLLQELRSLPFHKAVMRSPALRQYAASSLPSPLAAAAANGIAASSATTTTTSSTTTSPESSISSTTTSSTTTSSTTTSKEPPSSTPAAAARGVSPFAPASFKAHAWSEQEQLEERTLQLADKVSMLLLTMLLRPAGPADLEQMAQGPSVRLTLPISLPWAPDCPPELVQSWDALLDVSCSSLVESEVEFLHHELGLLKELLGQAVARVFCASCFSSLDCMAQGHQVLESAASRPLAMA